MSDVVDKNEASAAGPCDQLLDYAYDELAAEARANFEAHLSTCAKCQAELASIKRVRRAVKTVMPTVEPPASATGALHAQLLHAAAQRHGGGGKVIPLGRRLQKVMLSPAFLAAATFVLVGGAAGTLFYRGKVMLPAKEAAAPAPSAPAEAAEPNAPTAETKNAPAADVPAAAKPTEKSAEAEKLDAPATTLAKGRSDENQLFLGGKDGVPMPVKRAASSVSKKEAFAPAKLKKSNTDDALGGLDTLGSGSGRGAVAGDVSTRDEGGVPRRREEKPAVTGGTWNAQAPSGYAGSMPSAASTAPAAPPAPSHAAQDRKVAPTPVLQEEPAQAPAMKSAPQAMPQASGAYRSSTPMAQGMSRPAVPSPAPKQDLQSVKRKALSLADAGRCDQALPLFVEVMRDRSLSLTPLERLKYVDCLRQTHQLQQATDQLEQLKRNKAVTNQKILDEEQLLQREASAPAKASAPPQATSAPADASAKAKRAKPAAHAADPQQAAPASTNEGL